MTSSFKYGDCIWVYTETGWKPGAVIRSGLLRNELHQNVMVFQVTYGEGLRIVVRATRLRPRALLYNGADKPKSVPSEFSPQTELLEAA